MRWWMFSKPPPPPPPATKPVFHVGEYVQVDSHGAECPLMAGGVYKVTAVSEDGNLSFGPCERGHCPIAHGAVRIPTPATGPRTKSWGKVRLREDAVIVDHQCTLSRVRVYNIGSIDDFDRVFFHHQGCDHWHYPEHLIEAEAEIRAEFRPL